MKVKTRITYTIKSTVEVLRLMGHIRKRGKRQRHANNHEIKVVNARRPCPWSLAASTKDDLNDG